eukprot:UN28608
MCELLTKKCHFYTLHILILGFYIASLSVNHLAKIVINNSYFDIEKTYYFGWDKADMDHVPTYCDEDAGGDVDDMCQYGRTWFSLTLINLIFMAVIGLCEVYDTVKRGISWDNICDANTILSKCQIYLELIVILICLLNNCWIWTEFYSAWVNIMEDAYIDYSYYPGLSLYFNVVAGILSIFYSVIICGWMERPGHIPYTQPVFDIPPNRIDGHGQPLAPGYPHPGSLPPHWEIKMI